MSETFDPDDPSNRDPDFIRKVAPIVDAISTHYFRAEFEGEENAPTEGPLMAIGNHSGGPLLPDVWVAAARWWRERGIETPAYVLVHDLPFQVPGVREALVRLGGLRASRENAAKVLRNKGVVLAFPGGDLEAMRSFRRRNRIDFRDRTGFIEVALEHGAPILPFVNVGGHEVYLTLFSSRILAQVTGLERLTGVKTLSMNLGLPWGLWPTGLLPYLPLPSKLSYMVGKPMYFPNDPALARDPLFVASVYKDLTRTMQDMVDQLARRRRWPVLG